MQNNKTKVKIHVIKYNSGEKEQAGTEKNNAEKIIKMKESRKNLFLDFDFKIIRIFSNRQWVTSFKEIFIDSIKQLLSF